MAIRENNFVAAFNYVKEQDAMRAKKQKEALEESMAKHSAELDRIYNIRESRESILREHSRLLENAKNAALGAVIKAIYIEALEPATLTDNGIILAENMVDSWIKSKGGAARIIAENRNKTYLLNRLCAIAEEQAEKDVKEVEEDPEATATPEEAKSPEEVEKDAKVTQLMAQAQALIAKATAIQNGEDVPEDSDVDTQGAEDTGAEADAGEDVSADDLSQDSGEEEAPAADTSEEEAESDDSMGDVGLDDDDDESEDEDDDDSEEDSEDEGEEKESEKSEEESEEPAAEEEAESDEDEESEDDDAADVNADESEGEESDDSMGDVGLDDEEDVEDDDVEDDGSEDASDITGDEDGEDLEDDGVSVNDTGDENTEEGEESKAGDMYEELEQEEDVKKAVQLIRQRVADAEEDFIKRNAEDKKQIDDLLGKISDNIKTVEDIADNDSPKSKVAQENVKFASRQIKSITENRPQKVLEKMVRKFHESVLKDAVLKENYTLENGQIDIASVIESSKVMYGFLEALNVLQLEKVDDEYIKNVIENI